MKRILIAICALVFATLPARSQDIHFTLYDMAPLVFNPAETGGFYGSYRLSGIYRDQWLSVFGVPDEFKTPSFSVDVPVIKGFRDQDWVGVGVMFYGDKAGSLGLTNSAFKLSAAYHLALNKKGTSVLAFGYQTGSVQRRLTSEGLGKIMLESDNFAMGAFTNDPAVQAALGGGPGGGSGGELKKSYTDHIGGLHLKVQADQTNLIQIGVSVGHIGGRRLQGNLLNQPYQVPMRFLGHGSWRTVRTDRLALNFSGFFQTYDKANEIQIQGTGEYLFNEEKGVILIGGFGYRLSDALQVLAGVQIQDIKVMLGYDLNTSRFTPATGTFGGFELSAMYIGTIFKRPDPDPVLFCPRF